MHNMYYENTNNIIIRKNTIINQNKKFVMIIK